MSLIPHSAKAQATGGAPACSSAETILQRYTNAVGGKAVNEINSLSLTAKESTVYRSVTEHWVYKFKWKAPTKVVAGGTPYLLNILPVSYPDGTFIFDGEAWSNFDRRKSRNEDAEPAWRRELRHKYPYNEDPQFMMFRILADPLMIARGKELYTSFAADSDSAAHPGLCVLRAYGADAWRTSREDILAFDAAKGFLKTWTIQAGSPQHRFYCEFQFDDYRQVGSVKFPRRIDFDFYKATFRYTEIVINKSLPDSDFVLLPAKP